MISLGGVPMILVLDTTTYGAERVLLLDWANGAVVPPVNGRTACSVDQFGRSKR